MKIRKLWLPPAPLIDSFKVSVESRLAPRFAKIIFLAFLAEMAAMYLAAHLSIRGYLLKGLVDSAVISFILFPGLYLFIYADMERAEAEIKRQALQQETAARLGQIALSGIPINDLLNESVLETAKVLDVEFCKVLELKEDGSGLLLRHGVGWKEGLIGSAIVDSSANSQAGYTLLSREPVIVKYLPDEKRFHGPQLLFDHGIVSGMSVVIGTPERPYGVLGAHSSRRRTFSKDEVNFLLSVSNVLAGAIERKRSEEDISQSKHDWEDTFNSITDMITIHDCDFNIIAANKAAQKILRLPFLEKKPDAKCFKYYHGALNAPAGCPSCSCLKSGQRGTFELFEPHLNMFIEIRAVPRIDRNDKTVGLIHIVRDITERKKSEELMKGQYERMAALRSIDAAINSSLDMKVTLNMILEQITAQLKVDAADVLLFDSHAMTLSYAAGREIRTKMGEGAIAVESLPAGKAVMENMIIKAPDLAGNDGRISEIFREDGFKAYFAVPLTAKGQVKGVLEIFHRSPLKPDPEWLNFLELLGGQVAIALDNISMFNNLQRSNFELLLAYDRTIEGWARALDYRDKETEGHSRRVTNLAIRIAQAMGIQGEDLIHIRRGALLHDIGKLGVPDSILLKMGKLTQEEWQVMKKHPETAAELLSQIPFLKPAMDIPYCHHEKWDGTGYPRGLKGEQIPLAARIFAIVDVWDALHSDRPYRAAWTKRMVIDHIRALSGQHFDPQLVDISLKVLSESANG
ncbi:MAG: GAF domain-containing protein [Nitrospiraceae bacterium]|nr:GAF domain-containing protein [Nitrospiraceae bacterium]